MRLVTQRHFDEARFNNNVNTALKVIKTVLDTSRSPKLPSEVPHVYDDKYLLADFLSRISISSQLCCLEVLGLKEHQLEQFKKWAKNRTVTLRFKAEETCTHVKDVTREVESSESSVKVKAGGLSVFGVKQKEITKVIDSYWKFTYNFELFGFSGNNPDDKILIQTRSGETELITTDSKASPKPNQVIHPPIDVEIGWLLHHISDSNQVSFGIERENKNCFTPRRNPQISNALEHFKLFHIWSSKIVTYFRGHLFPIQKNSGNECDLGSIDVNDVFVASIPLFESSESILERKQESNVSKKLLVKLPKIAATNKTPLLSVDDSDLFLAEQIRSIEEKLTRIKNSFVGTQLVTNVEAKLLIGLLLVQKVSEYYEDGVDYIENMLRKQLISAIGKVLKPEDFSGYMKFHNNKLFGPLYQPKPFSYAIRIPDHYPEGTISIESKSNGNQHEPIYTLVRKSTAQRPMSFAINAATNISFYGDRYVHAYVKHQFSDSDSNVQVDLIARTRQFSNFILLVGGIPSADVFEPMHAIILQNKDELIIPLVFETIPSPKAFKSAISSLSPEQQRFAKAIRSLQLSETVFGIVVIQIKPQLEKVLNLPHDSLTKEIKMTQDLMQFFIKYQVPTDLISYSKLLDQNAPVVDKVNSVRANMKAMNDMISGVKEKAMKDKEESNLMNLGIVTNYPTSCYICGSKDKPTFAYYRNPTEPTRDDEFRRSGLSAFCSKSSCSASVNSYYSKGWQYYNHEKYINPPPSTQKSGSKINSNLRDKDCDRLIVSPGLFSLKRSVQSSRCKDVIVECDMKRDIIEECEDEGGKQEEEEKEKEKEKNEEDNDNKEDDNNKDKEIHIGVNNIDDYSKLPEELDKKFEELDIEGTLRPTKITTKQIWTKISKPNLMADATTSTIDINELNSSRKEAFELLDSLSRSGCLSFDHACLHVIVSSTHCFDLSLMDTVIKQNVNPIEKVERSMLIVGSTIQNKPVEELIQPDQLKRVSTYSPILFSNSKLAITDKQPTKQIIEKEEKVVIERQ